MTETNSTYVIPAPPPQRLPGPAFRFAVLLRLCTVCSPSPNRLFFAFCSRENGRRLRAKSEKPCLVSRHTCICTETDHETDGSKSPRAPRRVADRIRQSDIKFDVRLPDVIASRPPAALLERPTEQRAPLECADERAPGSLALLPDRSRQGGGLTETPLADSALLRTVRQCPCVGSQPRKW